MTAGLPVLISAAQIHERVCDAMLAQDDRRAVGRIFLADAAEVELHAGTRQADVRVAPLDAIPADQLAHGVDFVRLGNARWPALEIPDAAQHARGHVEASRARRMTAIGVAKQRRGLAVDCDRPLAGGAIDGARNAVVAIARVLGFDASHVGDDGRSRAIRACLIDRRKLQLVLRRHRREAIAKHAFVRACAGQKRFDRPNSIHRAENCASPGLPLPPARQSPRWR